MLSRGTSLSFCAAGWASWWRSRSCRRSRFFSCRLTTLSSCWVEVYIDFASIFKIDVEFDICCLSWPILSYLSTWSSWLRFSSFGFRLSIGCNSCWINVYVNYVGVLVNINVEIRSFWSSFCSISLFIFWLRRLRLILLIWSSTTRILFLFYCFLSFIFGILSILTFGGNSFLILITFIVLTVKHIL